MTSLFLKKSGLPDSGRGLFTRSFIPKNTKVCEYKGKITSWGNAAHDGGNNAYLFYINKNHVIDAKNNKTSLAGYANDARGISKVKGLVNNCIYIVEKKRVFIKAIRDIPAGSEVLVGYGKEYWDIIKNLAFQKKKSKKNKLPGK